MMRNTEFETAKDLTNVNDFKSAGEVRKKYDYFKDRFNKALSLYSSHSNLNYFEGIND